MPMKRTLLPLAVAALLTPDFPVPARADVTSEDVFFAQFTPVVTASKKAEKMEEAPGIISVITAEQIRRFGARNLREVLDRAPSVYTLGSYLYPDALASMRGDLQSHVETHVLFLLNSRPLRESTFGSINIVPLETIPVEAIDRVEIVRGPGSVLYGTNAYTGVINVITKAPSDETALRASGGGGSLGTRFSSVSLGKKWGGFGLAATGTHYNTRGWTFSARGEGAGNPAGSGKFTQENSGGTLQMGYKGLTLNGYYGNTVQQNLGVTPAWPLESLSLRRTFLDGGYKWVLGQAWETGVNLTFNNSALNAQDAPPLRSQRDAHDVLAEATLSGKWGDNANLLIGVVDNREHGHFAPYQTADYTIQRWAAYGQVDVQPAPLLKLVAGGQWNKTEGFGSSFVPRGGILLNFSSGAGAKLLHGRAFRAPYAGETIFTATPGPAATPIILQGNPNLAPEKIATTDLQLFYNRPRSQAVATLFQSLQTDRITRSGTTFINTGELKSRGVEFEASLAFSAKVSLLGSYTYQENENQSGLKNVTFMPRQMAKLGVSYSPAPGATLGVFDSYFGKRTDVGIVPGPGFARVNPPADAYHWLTANLLADVGELMNRPALRGVTVRVYGVNLLDKEVFDPEFNRRRINTLPARPGRAVFGEIGASF